MPVDRPLDLSEIDLDAKVQVKRLGDARRRANGDAGVDTEARQDQAVDDLPNLAGLGEWHDVA